MFVLQSTPMHSEGASMIDIDDEFDGYMRSTNPEVPQHSPQWKESKRCFFAGALVMFTATLNAARASLTEDQGVDEIDALHRQLKEFSERVRTDRD
jgi:hypothetical protein